MASDRMVYGIDVHYEKITRDLLFSVDKAPSYIETLRVPVSAAYYHPSGFFSKLSATPVNQNIRKLGQENLITQQMVMRNGSEIFWTLDAQFGYRFPKRLGIFSFGIKNLLDKQFNYQDFYYQTGVNNPVSPQYQPGRFFYGQVTLSFN
ncbi:hypothetical protein A1355_15710 [Methylomonas koyamae]|uniref:Uncharacterized protein n=2 Tax=Methylomonas TaxID=416 RepID=A0A177N207_9GAMM|nr:hypothetical protein A1355_15710 [Methylomonas koyamae]